MNLFLLFISLVWAADLDDRMEVSSAPSVASTDMVDQLWALLGEAVGSIKDEESVRAVVEVDHAFYPYVSIQSLVEDLEHCVKDETSYLDRLMREHNLALMFSYLELMQAASVTAKEFGVLDVKLPVRPNVSLLYAISNLVQLLTSGASSKEEFLLSVSLILTSLGDDDQSPEAATFRQLLVWLSENLNFFWLRRLLDEWSAGRHNLNSMKQMVELAIILTPNLRNLKHRFIGLVRIQAEKNFDFYLRSKCAQARGNEGEALDATEVWSYAGEWEKVAWLEPHLRKHVAELRKAQHESGKEACLHWVDRTISKFAYTFTPHKPQQIELKNEVESVLQWLATQGVSVNQISHLRVTLSENTRPDTKTARTEEQEAKDEEIEKTHASQLHEQLAASDSGYLVVREERLTPKNNKRLSIPEWEQSPPKYPRNDNSSSSAWPPKPPAPSPAPENQ